MIDAGKRLTAKGIDHDLSAEQSAIEQILSFANGADAIHGDHDFAAIDVALPETIVAVAFELLHAGFELLLSLVRIWGVLIVIVRLVLTLSQQSKGGAEEKAEAECFHDEQHWHKGRTLTSAE